MFYFLIVGVRHAIRHRHVRHIRHAHHEVAPFFHHLGERGLIGLHRLFHVGHLVDVFLALLRLQFDDFFGCIILLRTPRLDCLLQFLAFVVKLNQAVDIYLDMLLLRPGNDDVLVFPNKLNIQHSENIALEPSHGKQKGRTRAAHI